MSDYDKNKFFRRTKFYPTSRDSNFGSRSFTKPPTFLKHDRDFEKLDRNSTSESKEKTMPQPTILLKAREPQTERSISPKRPSKENEPPQNQSSTTQEHHSVTIPKMTHSLKLLDDNALLSETLQEYLQDSPDFLVIGVIGSQGTGKSTILNLLAENVLTDQFKTNLFNPVATETQSNDIKILTENVSKLNVNSEDGETVDSSKGKLIFNPQSLEQIEIGNYETSGIDIYVTSNRVFLLDCQPIMSSSALDEQIDFKKTVAGEFLPTENSSEIHSLQLATFMLSVCHVVLIVEDWFFDSNLVRFLQTAEMLKPSIPMAEEDFMEYFPHVMIIHNRATLQDFTPQQYGIMQQVYRDVFSKSKLRFDSGMGLGNASSLIHSLKNPNLDYSINLFLIPEYDFDENDPNFGKEIVYKGHPGFDELVKELRAQVHSVTRIPLLSAQLTEKNWLQFASKVWDTIKKSSFFLEYSKLMP